MAVNRIQSVDAVRVLAILAVIALHTAAHGGQAAAGVEMNLPTIMNNVERFAVPVFFVISGFFWGLRCDDGRAHWARSISTSQRVMLIFLIWSLVYLMVPVGDAFEKYGWTGHLKEFYWGLRTGDGVLRSLLEGPKVHLWFLPALACVAIISGACLAKNAPRLLIALGIGLYLVGLCGGSYSATPIGFQASFSFRDGPFLGLIFYVTGYLLARMKDRSRWLPVGIVLAIAGLLLQLAEAYWLRHQWNGSLTNEYVIGTYPYGLGVALIALSNARCWRVPGISAVGSLVLGVYASHYIFVDALRPIDDKFHGQALWDLAYVMLVFAISLAVTYLLSRFTLTRRVVM